MTTALAGGALTTARAALPAGQALDAEHWRRRHLGILVLLWAHAVAFIAVGLLLGYSLVHSVIDAAPVITFAALAGGRAPVAAYALPAPASGSSLPPRS